MYSAGSAIMERGAWRHLGKRVRRGGGSSRPVVLAYHMPGPGGVEQVVVRTARLLGERGWRFAALCPTGALSRDLSEHGVAVREWPVTDLRLSRAGIVAALGGGLARVHQVYGLISGASLVHAHSLKACLLVYPACRRAAVPILWHVHDFLPLRRARRFLMSLAVHSADRIVAVSRAVAEETAAREVTVLHNGTEWTPLPTSGAPRDLVLFVGRLHPEKRPQDFVRLAGKCRSSWPDVRFVVVGVTHADGDQFGVELRGLAGRMGVLDDSYLTFAGHVEDVNSLLARAIVLVIPSQREPFGLVALEAMRAAVPVVGTTGGGLDDIVEDGRTGYLVSPGDVESLRMRVVSLLAHRNRAEAMGASGRHRYLSRFRAEQYAERLEAVYLRVAGN